MITSGDGRASFTLPILSTDWCMPVTQFKGLSDIAVLIVEEVCWNRQISRPPEVLLRKGVHIYTTNLQENNHAEGSAILIQLLCNFIEIVIRKLAAYFQNTFS